MPFLPLGRSCPLQPILLSDLVRCDSPLQIVMAFWRTIIPLLSAEECHTQPRKFEFKQKGWQNRDLKGLSYEIDFENVDEN